VDWLKKHAKLQFADKMLITELKTD